MSSVSSLVANWCWGQVWRVADSLQSQPRHFANWFSWHICHTWQQILKVPSTVTHRSWPFTYSLMYRFACMRRPSFKMCSRQKTSMYFLSFPLITSGQWDPLGRLPYFHLRCFVILWQAISISHYSITYSVKLWLWVILPDRVVHLSLC